MVLGKPTLISTSTAATVVEVRPPRDDLPESSPFYIDHGVWEILWPTFRSMPFGDSGPNCRRLARLGQSVPVRRPSFDNSEVAQRKGPTWLASVVGNVAAERALETQLL